jgi:hypothetical protein
LSGNVAPAHPAEILSGSPAESAAEFEPSHPVTASLSCLLLFVLPLAFCLGYVVAGLRAGASQGDAAMTSAAMNSAAMNSAAMHGLAIPMATAQDQPVRPGSQPVMVATPRRTRHIADRFRDADLDGDGVLSRSEARALRGVWQKFALIDANQDGRISRAELAQYRQQSKQRHRADSQRPVAAVPMSEQAAEQGRRR